MSALRATGPIVFWLAVSLYGDAVVVDGGIHRSALAVAAGVAVSLAGIWMLGDRRWARWESTTHDIYERFDLWPLIVAWDPDDWMQEPPWRDQLPYAAPLRPDR